MNIMFLSVLKNTSNILSVTKQSKGPFVYRQPVMQHACYIGLLIGLNFSEIRVTKTFFKISLSLISISVGPVQKYSKM